MEKNLHVQKLVEMTLHLWCIYCHRKGIELEEEKKLTLNLGISEDEFIRTDDNLDC